MITQEDIDAVASLAEPLDGKEINQAGWDSLDPDWITLHMSPLDMVRDFAERMDQPLDQKWQKDANLETLRWGLISEEYKEVCEASADDKSENMLKELADLVYVVYGYAATYGWDLDEALRRVHWSNLSKLGLDGKPIKNAQGKVIKGPNYQKPNLSDLLEPKNDKK